LLDPEISDVDGITVDRQGTVSVFNGPSPVVLILETEAKEIENVGAWLSDRRRDGVLPHELGVIVRSDAQLPRARSALESSGLAFTILGDDLDIRREHVSICTMHLAKGLEFRAVAVMACDDEVVPLQERIEAAAEESELEEVYNTERHLLYVACTRARDQLLVTGVAPGSEFLEDMAQ
jgi:superfamily I DNA/RNA helicase